MALEENLWERLGGGMGGGRLALGAFVDVFNHTSPPLNIRQNAAGLRSCVYLMYPMLYASPLITLNRNGYTKHYFEGSNRVCSKIGGGFGEVTWDQLTDTVPCISGGYVHLTQQQWTSVRQTFLECLNTSVDMSGAVDLYDVIRYEQGRPLQPERAFYYHSDHLGSAAYLTDHHGEVTQTLNYLPYSEDWVDIQHNLDPNLGQYTFNGKEKDYESGFHYYGARYYWSEVLTGWLSVDPMMDKYPNISPYNYCMWNPVKLIDPDGRDWVVIFNHEKKTVTVNAKYVTNSAEAHASAEEAIKAWNNLSGDYSLMVGDEKYSVNFNLSVIDKSEAVPGDPGLNAYKLVSELRDNDGNVDKNILGQTKCSLINVLEAEKDNPVTSSHEIGHSLGLEHIINGTKGLMEEDGGRLSGHHEITKSNVEKILHLALHPEDRNPKH